MKKIGVLTGGGDCPGLNAAIRAIVRKSFEYGNKVIGIQEGWRGLVENKTVTLGFNDVTGILTKGGTIIGTSRTNPFKDEESAKKVEANFIMHGLDALIAIGGEDTLTVATKLFEKGYPLIGLPKTIDNDIFGSDFTFGFDTAVSIATEAIDRIHTTAEAHNRVMIIEVMGRHAGWIATFSGIASGADYILIPEVPVKVEELCKVIVKRKERGKMFSIVVVAEGAKLLSEKGDEETVTGSDRIDDFGHVILGGVGSVLAKKVEQITGFETRVTILGHIQRGGTPTSYDRILATRFGVKAAELAEKGDFGKMVALQGNQIATVDLKVAVSKLKTVDMDLYKIASVFFG